MELFAAHRQWATRPADERYQDIESLHQAVQARRWASTESRQLSSGEIVARMEADQLTLETPLGNVQPTHWSMRQLTSRIGVPVDFLPKLTSDTASRVINERLAGEPFSASILTGQDSDGTKTLRAFNGERYTRLWDSDITSVLKSRLPSGWRNPVAYDNGEWGAPLVPSGLYAGDRDMFAFLISGGDQLDLGGRDQLNMGFFVQNSEVGSRTFSFTAFLFRETCGNNIVWGAEDVNIVRARHTKHIHTVFSAFELFLIKLNERAGLRDTYAHAIKAAKSRLLISPHEEAEKLVNRFKGDFKPSETLAARDRMLIEEPGCTGTAWDWVNGFTAAARTLPNTNTRLDLETRAGALIT